MASRKTTKVAALASRYQLRRGKKSDFDEAEEVETVIKGEPLTFAIKDEPGEECEVDNIDQIQGTRGKKRKPIHVKVEKEDGLKTSSPKVASNSAEATTDSVISNDEWFPPNWEKVLDNIRIMRKEVEAPVDSMGCDMCHDKTVSPEIQRYQILVSLMLSSQTKDQVTFAAMGRLREHGLTPETMVSTSDEVLENLLKPVGFYKRKTEYIKRTSKILLEKYGGDIPDSIDTLCELPGVGPKMAHICMNTAWNILSGIGVDTHVHRISQRLGWIPPEKMASNKKVRFTDKLGKKKEQYQLLTPEDVRRALESWLPKDLWAEVNHLLVGFGQTICKPVGPSCKSCLNYPICPSAKLKW